MSRGKEKRLYRVLALAKDEGCNTSADIANALGISVPKASAHVSDLIDMGLLRRTGLVVHHETKRGHRALPYRVFEAV